MWIPVFLSAASTKTVTAHYATLSFGKRYQAAVPQDYHAASGTVTFAPGKRWTLVPVVVVGDTLKEPNDAFLIGLSKPTNAVIGGFGGLGRGVIVNDD
jgi:hypothetical protein